MSYPAHHPEARNCGTQTATTCHCGSPMRGSDHCPECGCEEFESYCHHAYDPTNPERTFG